MVFHRKLYLTRGLVGKNGGKTPTHRPGALLFRVILLHYFFFGSISKAEPIPEVFFKPLSCSRYRLPQVDNVAEPKD